MAEFLANQTTFTLENLNSSMRYKFYLSAKTIKGSGPFLMEEAVTVMNTCRFTAKQPLFFLPPTFISVNHFAFDLSKQK